VRQAAHVVGGRAAVAAARDRDVLALAELDALAKAPAPVGAAIHGGGPAARRAHPKLQRSLGVATGDVVAHVRVEGGDELRLRLDPRRRRPGGHGDQHQRGAGDEERAHGEWEHHHIGGDSVVSARQQERRRSFAR
jgi:hypothetical protein